MALSKKKGRGSVVRWKIMTDLTLDAEGHYKRPADMSTTGLTLPEVNTSDVNISHATETDDTVTMYGSPAPGAGEEWTDAEPGAGSWTLPIGGVWQPVEADRANSEALRAAQIGRKPIWMERQIVGDDKWEGGAGFISTGAFPVPADGNVTWNATLTGKGKFWQDTSAATAAGA